MATKRIEPLDLAQESSSHEDGVPFLRIQHILYAQVDSAKDEDFDHYASTNSSQSDGG